jgi:hypothetical protein
MFCRIPLARSVGLAVLLAALSGSPTAQLLPVTVDKVEPINWTTGTSSDVMLSLSGLHLDDVVRATVKHRGVRVIRIESPDANHLFVVLRISPDVVEPGRMMLQLSTRFTTTFAAVPLVEKKTPLSSRGEGTVADK